MQVQFPKTVPKQGPRNRFQARLAGTGSQASVTRKSWFQSKISGSDWEPLLANLFLGTLLENLFLATLLEKLFLGTLLVNLFLGNLFGNLFLGTCCCEPCLGTSFWKHCLGSSLLGTLLGHLFLETSSWKHLFENLFWEPCFAWKNMFLEILLGKLAGNLENSSWNPCLQNLFLGTLGTCSWKPLPGNPCLGTLLGTSWEPCLGTSSWEPCLVTSSWEPCLGTSCWEPLLGNLFLVTSSWEPCFGTLLGNLAWEPLPGNLAWEPCVATSSWEPCLGTSSWVGTRFPTLRRADLTAPTCSGTFTMAEDLKLVVDLQLACRVTADLNYHPNRKNGPPSIPSALHHSPQDRDHLAMWGMPQDPQLLHAWVVRQLLGIVVTLVLHDYHGFGGCWCVSYHHFFQMLEINEMSWPTTTSITGWWFNWDDEIPNLFMESHSKFHGSSHHHI